MSGLAGRLRERVTITRSTGARDAIGGDGGATLTLAIVWAAIEPKGGQMPAEGDARTALPLWAVTVRPFDLRVGDGMAWRSARLIVRAVIADPMTPDRIEVIAEEQR